jgi:hypothetical protein
MGIEIPRTKKKNYLYEGLYDVKKLKKISLNDGIDLLNEKFVPVSFLFPSDIKTEEQLLRDRNTNLYICYMYNKRYGKEPDILNIDGDVYKESFLIDFLTQANLLPTHRKIEIDVNVDNNSIGELTFAFDGIVINLFGKTLYVYYDSEKHLSKDTSNPLFVFLSMLTSYKKPKHEKYEVSIVYKDEYGFDKHSFKVRNRKIDLDLNYNDNFKEISKQMVKDLNNNKKTSLYILNGDPGTGKSTYLRYLASTVRRNIIFISPDMVEHITDPSFIPFLMDNNDSILLIEDAEPVLQKRDGISRSGAISNILNMTDGLLSDCLNISVVATFNTQMKNIDEALLRKGRLLHTYTFENLKKEKATKLLRHLGKIGEKEEVTKDFPLSEIYFWGENNKGNAESLFVKRITGFKK